MLLFKINFTVIIIVLDGIIGCHWSLMFMSIDFVLNVFLDVVLDDVLDFVLDVVLYLISFTSWIRECSRIMSAPVGMGVGGLSRNADTADAFKGDGAGSKPKY